MVVVEGATKKREATTGVEVVEDTMTGEVTKDDPKVPVLMIDTEAKGKEVVVPDEVMAGGES